ncbi:MAG: transglutaminase-like domain-containing protein, partial [Chitinispirillaceae bacterium]|nr:transglutaminase-like domain-containing protein [Chitinispirillaceae bacterium]
MKIIQIITIVFLIFNCKGSKNREFILEKKNEDEWIPLLLSSNYSLFEIIEKIRIHCEKEIPEFKTELESAKDFNKYFRQSIHHIDYIKKTTTDPSQIIREINRYIFDELKIVPISNRESFSYIFPQCVFKNKIGNCVGLSLLYLLIGEEVNLPFYPVIVPGHLFVRYDDGNT